MSFKGNNNNLHVDTCKTFALDYRTSNDDTDPIQILYRHYEYNDENI
jgi:hypothetical protein